MCATVGVVFWSIVADRLAQRDIRWRMLTPAACCLATLALLPPHSGRSTPGPLQIGADHIRCLPDGRDDRSNSRRRHRRRASRAEIDGRFDGRNRPEPVRSRRRPARSPAHCRTRSACRRQWRSCRCPAPCAAILLVIGSRFYRAGSRRGGRPAIACRSPSHRARSGLSHPGEPKMSTHHQKSRQHPSPTICAQPAAGIRPGIHSPNSIRSGPRNSWTWASRRSCAACSTRRPGN